MTRYTGDGCGQRKHHFLDCPARVDELILLYRMVCPVFALVMSLCAQVIRWTSKA
ncbi:MAG: hypothetical protein ACO1O2_07655 [Larkinella arboricola]